MKRKAISPERRKRAGKALTDVLPSSAPPPAVPAKVRHTPPAASFPLVGSEVLEVTGSEGTPRREMHDVIRSSDDEAVERHLGPLEEASVSFRPDPATGDAGADFADEFGRSFLRSATTGEDISEIENADEMDASEIGGPFLEIDTNAVSEEQTASDDPSELDEEDLGIALESIDFPRDERGEPAPATQAPSGEIPAELEQANDEEWPDEKAPRNPSPRASSPRR